TTNAHTSAHDPRPDGRRAIGSVARACGIAKVLLAGFGWWRRALVLLAPRPRRDPPLAGVGPDGRAVAAAGHSCRRIGRIRRDRPRHGSIAAAGDGERDDERERAGPELE